MKLQRQGTLKNSNIQTGNELLVELFAGDVEALADPKGRHYATNRFDDFPHQRIEGGFGWDGMNKVHVYFNPKPDDDKFINLSLDYGGDLTFTIWQGERLQQASQNQAFDAVEPFLTSDPSGMLARVGVEVVRFLKLDMLAEAAQDYRHFSGSW